MTTLMERSGRTKRLQRYLQKEDGEEEGKQKEPRVVSGCHSPNGDGLDIYTGTRVLA